jgi:hypothetical protein
VAAPAHISCERGQMAASVVAIEFVGLGTKAKSKPRPFEEPQKGGHPENLNQFLGIDVLEWYHPSVFVRQQENTRKGVPPAQKSPPKSGVCW